MAKAAIPRRLVRDIEQTLQDRISQVRSKLAEHYEQCRVALCEYVRRRGAGQPLRA